MGGKFGTMGSIEAVDIARIREVRWGKEGIVVATRALREWIITWETGKLARIGRKQVPRCSPARVHVHLCIQA